MSGRREVGEPAFADASGYRIVVRGLLTPNWRQRLGDLVIQTCERPPRTTLRGTFRDQVELFGVLEILHGLHLTILEVVRVRDDISASDEP